MKGYKGFDKDLSCRGFKYEVGKTYKIKEDPILCKRGFHFCNSLQDVLGYYPLHKNNTFCEIEVCGKIISDIFYKKSSTNKIKILRKLDLDEILDIVGIKEKDLFVKCYNDDRFDPHQMYLIYCGFKEGLDASIYAKSMFNGRQMFVMYLGLEKGLNVSIYADPEFNDDQMYLIYYGLKEGLDASIYAKPELNLKQMHEIYLKLKEEKNGHSK